ITWRWHNLLWVGVGSFLLSYLWRFGLARREAGRKLAERGLARRNLQQCIIEDRRIYLPLLLVLAAGAIAFPQVFDFYQTNIMVNCLIYVMLGLGLNIVVGLAGLLDLGYVAFYAVGAYFYALCFHYVSFWAALPIAALLAMCFGVLLGFPVLRLRGDYLAIVTLGFGEIIRIVLQNWNDLTNGPSGIKGIERAPFYWVKFSAAVQDPDFLSRVVGSLHLGDLGVYLYQVKISMIQSTTYMYYLMLALVLFTVFVVGRLKQSRIGRAWEALKEDEVACQAMGIDKTRTKLTAFALGATWAGFAGVVFAAKTTFVNPASFTFMDSAMILCIVVVGGMGSIPGVMLGAVVLILVPEYLRAFSEFRMLAFAIVLVVVMVFRPQGLVSAKRKQYHFEKAGEHAG
ncbi:MAG: high-affinity branched-chain amino acid ABC transporter permease LivM, partial [Desulfovibrionaceae bacterium]